MHACLYKVSFLTGIDDRVERIMVATLLKLRTILHVVSMAHYNVVYLDVGSKLDKTTMAGVIMK